MSLIIQVYTGPRCGRNTMDADISTLGTSDLVAVNCENYDREPAIGSCTEIIEDDIEIVWMEGDNGSVWRTWKI